ncbi:MAG: MerR family transcriptional regulator [Patescibacteria group bacterium]
MDKLISVDAIIKHAKKEGIDFGKGNPYNRLRYYTKIGWLPHMVRKKSKDGSTKGHYPTWVVERLLLIEDFKKQGLNNDQITEKLKTKTKVQTLFNVFATPEMKNRLFIYLLIIGFVFLIAAELEIINIGTSKRNIINVNEISTTQIIDSGSAYIPFEKNEVFIPNTKVQITSKIHVTFNDDYSPASRYWIKDVKPGQGFIVTLDTATSRDAGFNWWISN